VGDTSVSGKTGRVSLDANPEPPADQLNAAGDDESKKCLLYVCDRPKGVDCLPSW